MFCVCVGRAGLPSVMLVYGERLLCLCIVGMRVRCSGSITRDTGVDCLSLYHFDWSTPIFGMSSTLLTQLVCPSRERMS